MNNGMHDHLWQGAAVGCSALEGGAICRDIWLQGVAVANEQGHLTADCPECSAAALALSVFIIIAGTAATVHAT